MFCLDLPINAAIRVELPTGGAAIMIHLGGGRFATNLPPLALAGVSEVKDGAPVTDLPVTDLPVTWDSGALPAELHAVLFVFDAQGAARAVEAAAVAGDMKALAVVDRMADAEKMLAAREKIGMVVPASGVVQ